MGNYATIFGIIFLITFIALLVGSIGLYKCSDQFNIDRYSESEAAGNVDVWTMLGIYFSPCAEGMGWLSLIILTPAVIILILTGLSHIPFFGRGG